MRYYGKVVFLFIVYNVKKYFGTQTAHINFHLKNIQKRKRCTYKNKNLYDVKNRCLRWIYYNTFVVYLSIYLFKYFLFVSPLFPLLIIKVLSAIRIKLFFYVAYSRIFILRKQIIKKR